MSETSPEYILERMSHPLIDELSEHLTPRAISLKKGDFLFQQGQSVKYIYYLLQGRITLNRSTIEGAKVILHVALAGDTLAEASLFSEQYHCSAKVDATAKLIGFKKSEVLQYLDSSPQFMKQLLAILASQVRELRSLNEIKNIRSAQERILAYIRIENRINIENLSLKDIAYKIGLTHETFYRELRKLEKSGQISRSDSMIKLII